MTAYFFIPIPTTENKNDPVFDNLKNSGLIVNSNDTSVFNYNEDLYLRFTIDPKHSKNLHTFEEVQKLAADDLIILQDQNQVELDGKVIFSEVWNAPSALYAMEHDGGHLANLHKEANYSAPVHRSRLDPGGDYRTVVEARELVHLYNSMHPENHLDVYGGVTLIEYFNSIC